jgi:predicted acylesterase/phospholipase RssA
MNESSAKSTQPNTPTQPSWIGLALSGGGFRATLFHLGVIRFLRDCNLLHKVKLISSVSGGSILAAHLALNWNKYKGEKSVSDSAEREITTLIKCDLRNRSLRRWFCRIIIPVRLVTFLLFRMSGRKLQDRCSFTAIFQNHFEELYQGATFGDLNSVRDLEVHMLATSLTTGELCKFTNTNFEVIGDKEQQPIAISFPKLSLAMAASTAFPLLCPAVPITPGILGCNESDLKRSHVLSDGGILDNLGFQELARVAKLRNEAHGLLIVSDAGANFDWETQKRYSFVISLFRNIRANDIVMRQAGKLVLENTHVGALGLCTIDIHRHLNEDALYALRPEHQTVARNVRTDFNSFSDDEISVLIHHGYAEAHAALRERGMVPETFQNSLGDLPSALSEKQMKIQDAQNRKWRKLFAPRDYITWVILVAACGWLALIGWGLYWRPLHKQMELSSRMILNEQKESRAQEDAVLYGNVNDMGDSTERHTYVIKVVEATGLPVPGAAITVVIGNENQTKYEGMTGKDGSYAFKWETKDKFARTHVKVDKAQFLEGSDFVSLGESSGHLVILNKR